MKKRFNYHFCTEQKTNNISKPEWFFTQLLTWLSANGEFIDAVLRHAFDDKAGYDIHRDILILEFCYSKRPIHNDTKP